MSTPNSGPTPPPDVSGSLGDVSKLAFLNDIPLTTEGEEMPAATPIREAGGDSSANDRVTDRVTRPSKEVVEPEVTTDEVTEDVQLDLPIDDPAPSETPGPQPKPSVNSNGTVSAKKGVRDYSQIAPEDVPYFKNMSDQSYVQAIKWYNTHKANIDTEAKYSKELNELKDYRFYSHPEAYKLSPEYNSAATQYRTQVKVASHWTKALGQLEAEQPIHDIAIDKDGNVIELQNEIPYSPELKAQVSVALQESMMNRRSIEANLDSLSGKYQTKNKEFIDFTSRAVDALVSPALREDKAFKSTVDRYLNKVIPAHLHDVPVLTGKQAATVMAFVQMAAQQIATLQKRGQVNSIKAAALQEQGPGDGVPANGNAAGDWRSHSMQDVAAEFEAMRSR